MHRLKVLAIEDSTTAFAAICLATRSMPDWSIDRAGTADTAMSLCETLDPDVVTLDLGLPGTDGLALLATIRARYDIPVLVVSASTYEGSPATAEALMRGADACFDKTRVLVDAPRFITTIAEAARAARKQPGRSAA